MQMMRAMLYKISKQPIQWPERLHISCFVMLLRCSDAMQHAGTPPGARPGLGHNRGDALLLARLLDVLHTANVQVRGTVRLANV
jgi:hypothetical protein